MSSNEIDMGRWDQLIANAGPSGAVRFDPEAPGGLRALTSDEEKALLEAVAMSDERGDEDREQPAPEQIYGAGTRGRDDFDTPSLQVLDEEHARDLRDDPRIPSRLELDEMYEAGEAGGWGEQTARAWEYLDARREIADERADAVGRGDQETVERLDQRHALLDHNYLGHVEPEVHDEEPER